MKEFNEKMKKEYTAPQMEVLALDVQGAMLSCSENPDNCVDVILDDSGSN